MPPVLAGTMQVSFLHGQGHDDFVAALEKRFAFRQVQTSRRRLAMTHRHGRNINANATRGFFKGTADENS